MLKFGRGIKKMLKFKMVEFVENIRKNKEMNCIDRQKTYRDIVFSRVNYGNSFDRSLSNFIKVFSYKN